LVADAEGLGLGLTHASRKAETARIIGNIGSILQNLNFRDTHSSDGSVSVDATVTVLGVKTLVIVGNRTNQVCGLPH